LDADKYQVTGPDSVTFTATIVSSVHLSPLMWRWAAAGGMSWDPWTQACAGTGTTCQIQVHGTGTMYYYALDTNGDSIAGNLQIVANVPDDADIDDPSGDVDTPGSSGSAAVTPISSTNSLGIAVNAYLQPEWKYTQGCHHCSPVDTGVSNPPDGPN